MSFDLYIMSFDLLWLGEYVVFVPFIIVCGHECVCSRLRRRLCIAKSSLPQLLILCLRLSLFYICIRNDDLLSR